MFTGSCDKTAKMWDLNSNQTVQIAQVRLHHIVLQIRSGNRDKLGIIRCIS